MTSRAEEGLRASLEVAAAARRAADRATAVEVLQGTSIADLELEALSRDALSAPAAGPVGLLRRQGLGFGFWLATAWTGLVVFAAVFENLLPLPSPNQVLAGPPNQGPSWRFPFGTDLIGHDIFSQVVAGARVSMLIGASSVIAGLLIGGGIGILAGFYRGAIDVIVVWVTDVLLTLPGLILLLTLVAFLGATLFNVLLAIAVLSIPAYARIARATALAVSQRDFVLAALALGARPRRVLVRDVLPLVALPIASYAAIGASIAILAEGALAYLGLGPANSLSWGDLIAAGQQQLTTAPQLTFAPMIIFVITIMALNYIGQKAGAALDPRQGRL
ncbi:MAG TPA: ABC transporter permease [Acidimicrobiales bacterium]|nr:ABC transporter permease [Acidimicrobiales bacterium]